MAPETQIIVSAKDLASDTFRKVSLAGHGLIGLFERSQGLVPFAGAGLGVHGLKELIESQVEYMDQAGKLAQKTGLTTQAYTEYAYAAMLADVPQETLSKGLARLSKNMAAAADGSGDAFDAFHAMNISVLDSAGKLKSADTILMEVSGKFGSYEDGAGKVALAMALFGRGGAEMIPLLNRGSAELAHMREEAQRMGRTFGDEVARNAEEVNDNFKRLHSRTDALKTLIVTGMLPALLDTSEYFLDSASSAEKYRDKLEQIEKLTRGVVYGGISAKNAVEMAGAAAYYGGKIAVGLTYGNISQVQSDIKSLKTSVYEDLDDIGRAYTEIWQGKKNKPGAAGEPGKHAKPAKGTAPIVKPGDKGEGASTLKTLMQDAMKAEQALLEVQGSYVDLTLTLEGDTYGATLMRNQAEYDKKNLETLKEFQKIQDEKKALAAKGKLTGEARELLDRQQAAVLGRMYWDSFNKPLKDSLSQIQNELEQMAHDAAHSTALAGFTGRGVYEAQVQAINAKYDALRMDPKTSQHGAAWDAEQAAALTRAGQDRTKALAQQRGELAQLTGNTREYYLAQAEVLTIERDLAATAQERAVKEQHLADVMAKANGDWVDASRKALQDYSASARDTWSNVNRFATSAAQNMEDAMVDSAMGTENAWTNSLKAIEREIIRVMVRQSAMGRATQMLGGAFSSGLEDFFGGGSFTENLNNMSSDQAGYQASVLADNIAGFAGGGPTPPGPILVGEEGPEIWNPGGPGFVYTADQTAAMLGGGGDSINVSINNSYDFRGADAGTEARLRRYVDQASRQTVKDAIAGVQAQARRGGSYAKSLAGRPQ